MTIIEEFIAVVGGFAKCEYMKRDKWILPSVCVAQAALESGWNLNAKTLFGIKGNGVTMKTKEWVNGKFIEVYDKFVISENVENAIKHYYDFITTTPRYCNCCNNNNYRNVVYNLIHTTDGKPYATDPRYIDKIIWIIEHYKLYKFDNKYGTYLVKQGDTLSKIAKMFNIELRDLIKANKQISNPNLIYPNQIINIP